MSGLELDAFTDLLEGAQNAKQVVELSLDDLKRSPVQVRAEFNPENNEDDAGLVQSIAQDGVIQPLLTTLRAEGGAYEIIDGHRRAAAARMVGLERVPCIVLTLDQVEAAFQTGISNLQRRNLTPLEEGRQYLELMRVSGLSARELADRLGRPVRTVQRRVSLTALPPRVQELLEEEQISVNQALACSHDAWGPALAELAAERNLGRNTLDEAVTYLEQHPGVTARDAVDRVAPAAPDAKPTPRRRSPRLPKAVDYAALIEDLEVELNEEQRLLLEKFAQAEQLDPYAVRWAALVLAGSPTMTTAAAVAYAHQLAVTPLGRALRAMSNGLEALERRARKRRQLTPNMAVAAEQVIRDLISRLAETSAALKEAAGLSCAGAAESNPDEEDV